MKKMKFIGMIFLFGIFLSCNKEDELSQEQEGQNINQMFFEIESLVNAEFCNNSAEWTFTSYGSKACGGPVGFIAYPTNIDTEFFLEKVEEHRKAEEEFNQKWSITSDCSVPSQPSSVVCENGSPFFEY